MPAEPAIALLEFDSIALGTRTADAVAKKAPLETFQVGTVQPGKYLLLFGGSVAAVQESRDEGLRVGAECLTDEVFLPDVHPQVFDSVIGSRRSEPADTLAIIECSGIPSTVGAADKAVKAALVTILEIRLGDELGGRGLLHLAGELHDVEAAVEAGLAAVTRPNVTARSTIIPRHDDLLRNSIARTTRFHH